MKRKASAISAAESGILNDSAPFRINRSKAGFTYSCPENMDENPISDISAISAVFESFGSCKWIIGTEKHKSGKLHFHADVKWDEKIDVKNVRAFDVLGVHPNIINPGKAWVGYCMKSENFVANYKTRRPVKLIDPTFEWEKTILKEIEEEPDDRTINWYWSDKGCVGKTSFCKYLTVRHDAVLLQGKGADVRNAVLTFYKDKGHHPELCVFPIPASFNYDYVSYEAIEQVKDMYFYSGKYEGGSIVGPCPHIYVFANEPPDESRMKADRWNIVNID